MEVCLLQHYSIYCASPVIPLMSPTISTTARAQAAPDSTCTHRLACVKSVSIQPQMKGRSNSYNWNGKTFTPLQRTSRHLIPRYHPPILQFAIAAAHFGFVDSCPDQKAIRPAELCESLRLLVGDPAHQLRRLQVFVPLSCQSSLYRKWCAYCLGRASVPTSKRTETHSYWGQSLP